MTGAPKLQVGGTLKPGRDIYVIRPEDDRLFALLLAREYVNVLSSRQMGKSSLMVRTVARLTEHGVRCATIDLAGEIGTPDSADTFYEGLLSGIARDLQLGIDLPQWWAANASGTVNQRLLRFFREVVGTEVAEPLVIFLDEIDSTLKLPFTDDLFTAIRSMYNHRPLVPSYERITFCLLGVATANELVKDRRSTPYNVGQTLELGDFDASRDDLGPMAAALGDGESGVELLSRVLHWTGGHPYLTAYLSIELRNAGANTPADVDRYIDRTFVSLEGVRGDSHFSQILRFVETRLSRGRAALALYQRVYLGACEKDTPAVAHSELKLSGLVKRNAEGCLVVRNRIYRRLYDLEWIEHVSGTRERGLYRFVAIGSLVIAATALLIALWPGAPPAASVVEVLFAPDGHRVVTLSQTVWERTMRLWDADTGALLEAPLDQIRAQSVAFSPDGRRLATAEWPDATARIWDANTGERLQILEGHTSAVMAVAFSPDGRRVATGSHDQTVRLWNANTGEPLHTLEAHTDTVWAVAFSPDGRRIATLSDATARIWDANTGERLQTLEGHSEVTAVAFSPDGHRVATASRDRTARLWNAQTGEPLSTLRGHTSALTAVAFSFDGRYVATASRDATARVWDTDTGQQVRVLEGHTDAVRSVAFGPDGRRLATASADGTARLWDTQDGEELLWYYDGSRLGYAMKNLWAAGAGGLRTGLAVLLILAVVALDFLVIRQTIAGGLPPARKTAWSMVVVLLPVLGLLLWVVLRPDRTVAARTGASASSSLPS